MLLIVYNINTGFLNTLFFIIILLWPPRNWAWIHVYECSSNETRRQVESRQTDLYPDFLTYFLHVYVLAILCNIT